MSTPVPVSPGVHSAEHGMSFSEFLSDGFEVVDRKAAPSEGSVTLRRT
jgi:hypothetical protein